jgi:signal transduction histidine kinase
LKLFRRYYLLTAFIVLAFILLGYQTSGLITNSATNPIEGRHTVFYAKLIDHLKSQSGVGDRGQALSRVLSWNPGGAALHFAIIDRNGAVLFPKNETLSFNWASVQKPANAYESVSIEPQASSPSFRGLIRFEGEPEQYLYVTYGERNNRWRVSGIFFRTFAALVVSVLLGIALSMILLFRSLRQKAELADSVLAELQSGNLKARFPLGKMDEIGQAMSRFNRMADEIERLVEQVKGAEKTRMRLLQELAHDLRTPVASLRSLLETLHSKTGMEVKLREELLSLALKETDYFERLIEDLLILAQVSEPRYHAGSELVSIGELLEDEAESVSARYEIGLKKQIPSLPDSKRIQVQGDVHLLRRMIRNGLDNAFSFAKSEVSVSLRSEEAGKATIEIVDDGSGFSEEALLAYGERRVSRVLGGGDNGGRLSVGLGSVILKTVAVIHGGAVRVKNVRPTGASLTIELPTTGRPPGNSGPVASFSIG